MTELNCLEVKLKAAFSTNVSYVLPSVSASQSSLVGIPLGQVALKIEHFSVKGKASVSSAFAFFSWLL